MVIHGKRNNQNWLVVWNMFFHILGIIIIWLISFWGVETTNQFFIYLFHQFSSMNSEVFVPIIFYDWLLSLSLLSLSLLILSPYYWNAPPNCKHGDLFLLLGACFLIRVALIFQWKTLIINIKKSVSNLIKPLIKIYLRYCQKPDFEAFPKNLLVAIYFY